MVANDQGSGWKLKDIFSNPETVSTSPHAQRRTRILLAAVLLVVTLTVVRGINNGEFNHHVDETQHAMTGLFFADLISDHPLTHPVEYAYRYYAQYPAVSVVHWPPFFYFVEAVMFLLLGPSVIAARLAILLFALLGIFFWFKLVAELQNEWAAAVSSIVLAFLPSMLLLEKSVMLEIPSLALCIAASYVWMRFLRDGTPRLLYWFSLLSSLALLTKQHSIYLATFCLLTVLVERKWRTLLNWTTSHAVLLGLLMVAPFYLLSFKVHFQTIVIDVAQRSTPGSANSLTFYWLTLPGELGWVLLGLSAVGLATCRWWARNESARFMLVWILSCYITFSFFAGKEARYIIYWLPAFVFFAVGPWTSQLWKGRSRVVATALVILLVGQSVWFAWRYERPYISGYAAAARQLTKIASPGVILFDGDLPANFIFFMRAFDPSRRFIIMRKALYVERVMKEYGSIELLHSSDEIRDLLKRYGIRFIVVSQDGQLEYEVQRTLRTLLNSPQFRLVQKVPIDTNLPEWQGRSLLIYENTQAGPPTEEFLHIRMLTLTHDIVVRLSDLNHR
jgi:dolichyl-phosphate-mannose-protein mannosyltransferase